MKTKYYAIYGMNGLGIYMDYDKVLEARNYIKKGYKVKAFGNRKEACMECIKGYNDLQEEWQDCYRKEEIKTNNFTLYRKQIRKQNEKEEVIYE